MKKLIFIFLLMIGSLVASAQTAPFNGFLKPVPDNLFKSPTYLKGVDTTIVKNSLWLFRFDASITAVAIQYDKTTKSWLSSPLSSVGPGLGYKHYTLANGKPYNDFGVNLIALVGYDWTDMSKVNLSLVGTVNFLEYVNIGGGYNFLAKAPLVVLGATIKF
jgi:hypothetical protein